MKPIEILDKMIARFKTVGWRADGGGLLENNSPESPETPLCILNTVDAVAYESGVSKDNYRANSRLVIDALRRVAINNYGSMAEWNDRQTSVEPIIEACKKAKKLLENK